eukprot:tig00000101_g4442.t1
MPMLRFLQELRRRISPTKQIAPEGASPARAAHGAVKPLVLRQPPELVAALSLADACAEGNACGGPECPVKYEGYERLYKAMFRALRRTADVGDEEEAAKHARFEFLRDAKGRKTSTKAALASTIVALASLWTPAEGAAGRALDGERCADFIYCLARAITRPRPGRGDRLQLLSPSEIVPGCARPRGVFGRSRSLPPATRRSSLATARAGGASTSLRRRRVAAGRRLAAGAGLHLPPAPASSAAAGAGEAPRAPISLTEALAMEAAMARGARPAPSPQEPAPVRVCTLIDVDDAADPDAGAGEEEEEEDEERLGGREERGAAACNGLPSAAGPARGRVQQLPPLRELEMACGARDAALLAGGFRALGLGAGGGSPGSQRSCPCPSRSGGEAEGGADSGSEAWGSSSEAEGPAPRLRPRSHTMPAGDAALERARRIALIRVAIDRCRDTLARSTSENPAPAPGPAPALAPGTALDAAAVALGTSYRAIAV